MKDADAKSKTLTISRLSSLSSTPSAGGSGDSVLIFLAILVLLIVRRIYRSYHGMRFSVGRTIAYAVFYVALGSVFSILSFFEGVSLIFAVPYVAVLLAAAVFSYRFSHRRISFWQGSDGVYFKGGVLLYIIYVVGLIARLSIDFIVFGPSLFVINPAVQLASTDLYATIAVDLLLMFGLGLLIGRNAKVLDLYRKIEHGEEKLPDSPPPIQPLFGSGHDGTSS